MTLPPDPSGFFRLNEELAREVARLEAAGHLDGLIGLLDDAGSELRVEAARPGDGLEELIGVLRPGQPRRVAVSTVGLGPRAAQAEAQGCGCGPGEAPKPLDEGGWDFEGVLATRSRFSIQLPDGSAREVYMPDHVCPSCWNESDNKISSCSRVCARCGFAW